METLLNLLTGLVVVTCSLIVCYMLTTAGWYPVREFYGDDTQPTPAPLRVMNPGETIQPYPTEVHISTVVSCPDFPALNGFNIFLNGWARYTESVDFKCCLIRTGPDGQLETDVYIEVKAWLYHLFTQWLVDMQAAEFSCSVSRDQLSALGLANFTHIAVAQDSCLEAPRTILPIQFPSRMSGTVGICLKISYGSLQPTQVLEWMEYHRLMGVTTVFTYTWDLDPPVQALFDYYVKEGFLQAVPVHPPSSKDGPARGFRRPRYEEQAWVDEIWAGNDCKHRMFGLDYVIVMDMDEFIVPKTGMRTYHDILSRAYRSHPDAGGFQFDSHVVLLNWGTTRDSPLHIGKYTLRTRKANYDGVDRNSRWAFIPKRTYFVLNNLVIPQKPFTSEPVPQDLYTLLHYRSCKPNWKRCTTRPRLEDKSVVRYELPLVRRILGLTNLDQLLYNDTDYVRKLRDWSQEQKILIT